MMTNKNAAIIWFLKIDLSKITSVENHSDLLNSELFSLIHNEHKEYDKLTSINILLTLETPKLSKELYPYCIIEDQNLTTEILEGYFPITGGCFIDNPFKSISDSIFKKNKIKDSTLTIEETSFMKHANLAFEYLASTIVDGKENSYAIIDFIACTKNCYKFIDFDNESIKKALLTIPTSNSLNSNNNNNDWYQLPLVYWLVTDILGCNLFNIHNGCSLKSNIDIDVLFKLLNKELIDLLYLNTKPTYL